MKNVCLYMMFVIAALALAGCRGTTTDGPLPENSTDRGTSNERAGSNTAMDGNYQGTAGMPQGHGHGGDPSMMASAPNAANAPFDLQFIDSMVHHHQGAVMMSEMVTGATERAELREFAQKIITDQRGEIDRMKAWRDAWYPGQPSALNMEMPGMGSQRMMSGGGMDGMGSMRGADFDLRFLDMMIPHHQGAIEMAEEVRKRGEHAELKTLAEEIIREQRSEIEQMERWRREWGR